MNLNFHISKERLEYTGSELRPHFLLERLGQRGSAIAAFVGPCSVKTESLVDWEDRLKADRIEASEMLHLIGEFFELPLREAVLWQRLLIATVGEELRRREIHCERRGDDLFCEGKKLSVSIATASPVSSLIHVGININPNGAPVPAIGLQTWGVTPVDLVSSVFESLKLEMKSVEWACAKVRPVF